MAGNGTVYREGSVDDMIRALGALADEEQRRTLGNAGRAKMVRSFSWVSIARSIADDYAAALAT